MLVDSIISQAKDFTFSPDRGKASGRMYGGGATAELAGIKFHLKLWHHGGDNETKESLIKELNIQAITIDGRYYSIGWYCIITQNELWLHKGGWFGFELEKRQLEKFAHTQMQTSNHNFPRDVVVDAVEATKRGFVRIL